MHTDHHQIAKRIYTENHKAAARTIARRHNRHPDDPAVQDAIATATTSALRFLQRGGQLETVNERAWFTTIASRAYTRPLSRPEARLTQPIDDWVEDTIPHHDATPEEAVIDAAADDNIHRALNRALGRLSKLQRDVITAQASGLTYAEISHRTGLSATAVDKAIQRARRNLRNDGRLTREINAWRA